MNVVFSVLKGLFLFIAKSLWNAHLPKALSSCPLIEGVCCVMVHLQEVRGQAYTHWLAAAGVGGAHQAEAFAKLGQWYADFKADVPRARKCFQRGLGVNPLQAEAGRPRTFLTHPAGSLLCTIPSPPSPFPFPPQSPASAQDFHTKRSSDRCMIVASLGVLRELQSLLLAARATTQLSIRRRSLVGFLIVFACASAC